MKKIIRDRLIKSLYMGLILDKKSNDYLGKEISLTRENLVVFAKNFNAATDLAFNEIRITFEDNKYSSSMGVKTIGDIQRFTDEEMKDIIKTLENLINENLKKAVSSQGEYIDVYDLNTLDLLHRHTYNTMGDKYLASNRKRYMVNFMCLYSVGEYC